MKTIPQFSRIKGGKYELIDMFDRSNWSALVQAVNQLTRPQDKEHNTETLKYGLKDSIYYTLMLSSRILEGEALAKKD